MKSFAETFFKHFGVRVETQADELIVDLSPELAGVFGKARLYLVFPQAQGQPRELSPHEDLMSYGSRTFDRMLGLLAGRGEAAHLCFPERVPVSQAPPLPLHNCQLLESEVNVGRDQFYVFNFRATYVSDEKQETFVTVTLDAQGQPAPDTQQMLVQLDGLALAPEAPISMKSAVLRRMIEAAGEAARQQVGLEAARLEEAIKPRLERVLLRLASYYRRLMAEVDTGDPGQDETVRAELQEDLHRKIADELERHRLRVTLSPISYAVAVIPFAHYQLRLATRQTQQELQLARNLHTGQIEHFRCFGCREPLDHLALCEREHPVHAHCLSPCQQCGRDICRGCGIQACALCGSLACVDCIAACAQCQRWLCARHIQSCAICEQPYCPDHGFRCRRCHQSYCRQCEAAGECQTCRQAVLAPEIEAVTLPPTPGLRPERYRWQQAQNKRFSIYIGRSQTPTFIRPLLGQEAVVVVNQAGEVVYWDKRGVWRQFFKALDFYKTE
jgi:hypothetical protein